MRVIRQGAQ